jgi:hypothetical protein
LKPAGGSERIANAFSFRDIDYAATERFPVAEIEETTPPSRQLTAVQYEELPDV